MFGVYQNLIVYYMLFEISKINVTSYKIIILKLYYIKIKYISVCLERHVYLKN